MVKKIIYEITTSSSKWTLEVCLFMQFANGPFIGIGKWRTENLKVFGEKFYILLAQLLTYSLLKIITYDMYDDTYYQYK